MSRRRTFDNYKSVIREIFNQLSQGPFVGSMRKGGNIYRDVMEILVDFGYVANTSSRSHPTYVWISPSIFPADDEIRELIEAGLDKNRKTHKKTTMEESASGRKAKCLKVDRKITAIVEMLRQGKSPDRIYRELNENPGIWGGGKDAKVSYDYIEDKCQIWKHLGRPSDPVDVIDKYRETCRRDRQKVADSDPIEQDGSLFPSDQQTGEGVIGNMPVVSALDNLLLMMAIGFETIASEIRGYIKVFREDSES